MNNYQNLGFDTDKYLKYQSATIKSILNKPHDKLYIEFGGKYCVLPYTRAGQIIKF